MNEPHKVRWILVPYHESKELGNWIPQKMLMDFQVNSPFKQYFLLFMIYYMLKLNEKETIIYIKLTLRLINGSFPCSIPAFSNIKYIVATQVQN